MPKRKPPGESPGRSSPRLERPFTMLLKNLQNQTTKIQNIFRSLSFNEKKYPSLMPHHILLDSSVWITYFSEKDVHYNLAKDVFRKINEQRRKITFHHHPKIIYKRKHCKICETLSFKIIRFLNTHVSNIFY